MSEVKRLLEASTRWMQGAVNAMGFVGEVSNKEAAAALESGARCFRKAAELMEEAAKLLLKL